MEGEIIDLGKRRTTPVSLDGLVRGNDERAEELLVSRAEEILKGAEKLQAHPDTLGDAEALGRLYTEMKEWLDSARGYAKRHAGYVRTGEFKKSHEEIKKRYAILVDLFESFLEEHGK